MQTYIHVNRHVIDENRKNGTDKPALTVKRGKNGKPRYASEVRVEGPCTFLYSPHEPILPCGARVVVVTDSAVEIVR